MCVRNPITLVFYITSIRPFLFDLVIYLPVPEEDSSFPILIWGHAQDGNLWDTDLHHKLLDVVMIFKSDKKHVKNINNIHTQ